MSVLIFDTETTDKNNGEIIEAAWLRIAEEHDLIGAHPDRIPTFMECTEFCAQFKPSKPSTFAAMAVHHILPAELEGMPPSSSFALPADTEYLIGHSIDFDWQAAGAPPNIKRIDTHAMAQHVWPNATGYSQTALMYMLLLPTPDTRDRVRQAHGAMADVLMNLTLLRHILQAKPEILTWSGLYAFSEECRIPRTCPMKKYEGVPLDELDEGFIYWCLRQDWLDHYFRIGLQRVLEKRDPVDSPMFDEVVAE